MESRKLIIKSDTSVGGRDRITYHITGDGKAELKKMLKEYKRK